MGREAAVDDDGGAGDERRLVGGQEEHGARDLTGFADAADRVRGGVLAPQVIGAVAAENLDAARVDGPGAHAVDVTIATWPVNRPGTALSLGDLVASHRRFVERETETGT